MSETSIILGATAVVGGLAVGMWLYHGQPVPDDGQDQFAACRDGVVATGGAALGGPFTLTDHTGARVTDADVIDGPTMVYFGYTYCPDICPVDAANIAQATEILEERGVTLTPVFISIDPARDDPDTIADFVGNLHPRMVGLTGAPEEVRDAAKAYRAYYAKVGDDPEDYLMDHSTFAYLMAPDAGFLDIFRRELGPEGIADKAQCFIEAL